MCPAIENRNHLSVFLLTLFSAGTGNGEIFQRKDMPDMLRCRFPEDPAEMVDAVCAVFEVLSMLLLLVEGRRFALETSFAPTFLEPPRRVNPPKQAVCKTGVPHLFRPAACCKRESPSTGKSPGFGAFVNISVGHLFAFAGTPRSLPHG